LEECLGFMEMFEDWHQAFLPGLAPFPCGFTPDS
jgi:hypothetical protein